METIHKNYFLFVQIIKNKFKNNGKEEVLELQMFYHSIPPFFWRNFKEYAKNRKKQGKAINNTQNTQK